MLRHEKAGFCIWGKKKAQINSAVTAQLISAFVFATQLVQSLYLPNPKIQASGRLLLLYSPLCIRPGQKLRGQFFSRQDSYINDGQRM